MKKTQRKITALAWINDTWLSPYAGYVITMIEYLNGRIDIILDGSRMKDVGGTSVNHRGWSYTVKTVSRKI